MTEFTIDVPARPEKELREYTVRIFEKWDGDLGVSLPLPDYSIRLEVEEGWIKGKGRVAADAISIVTFISGSKEISWAVRKAGSLLVAEAAAPYAEPNPKLLSRQTTGRIGELERLIARVQSGQLDRREAAILAEALFAHDEEEPGLEDLEVRCLILWLGKDAHQRSSCYLA